MDEDEVRLANNDANQQIVYVKENPALKFIMGSTVAIVGVVLFLFAVGFLMSFVGFRPPTFDKNIMQDQWDRKLHDPVRSYDECVKAGGSLTETFPPVCTLETQSFTQPIADACADSVAEAACDPATVTPAYRTGQDARELLETSKDSAKSFWDGFQEGSSE